MLYFMLELFFFLSPKYSEACNLSFAVLLHCAYESSATFVKFSCGVRFVLAFLLLGQKLALRGVFFFIIRTAYG
jgi:hypothetical protein